MIRVVAVLSLTLMLILVLYFPAARSAPVFLQQIRAEHDASVATWGNDHAFRMLQHMLEWHASSTTRAPLMTSDSLKQGGDKQVNQEVAAIGLRITNNEYFRSLNALLMLATYRFAVTLYFLPAFLPLLGAGIVDGLVRRAVKGTDFTGHNPEVFSLCASGTIVVLCCLVVGLVVPVTLPRALIPVLLTVASLLIGIGIANYHKRA